MNQVRFVLIALALTGALFGAFDVSAVAGATQPVTHGRILESGPGYRCILPNYPSSFFSEPHLKLSYPVSLELSRSNLSVEVTGSTQPEPGMLPFLVNPTIQITNAGTTIFDGSVIDVLGPVLGGDSGPPQPADIGTDPSACIVDFYGNTEGTVLLDQYDGGSGMFNAIEAYVQAGSTGHWTTLGVLDLGGLGVVDLSGSPFLVVPNVAWSVGSASYGGMPVTYYSLQGGTFVNVTYQHQAAVATNASNDWRMFRASHRTSTPQFGLLLAWTGDECEIGHGEAALKTVHELEAQGKLSVKTSPTFSPGGPVGADLVKWANKLCPGVRLRLAETAPAPA